VTGYHEETKRHEAHEKILYKDFMLFVEFRVFVKSRH